MTPKFDAIFEDVVVCIGFLSSGGPLERIPQQCRGQEVYKYAIARGLCDLSWVPEAFHSDIFKDVSVCIGFLSSRRSFSRSLRESLALIPEENRSPEVCEYAVAHGLCDLSLVPEAFRSKEICQTLLKRDGKNFRAVPLKLLSRELAYLALPGRENLGLKSDQDLYSLARGEENVDSVDSMIRNYMHARARDVVEDTVEDTEQSQPEQLFFQPPQLYGVGFGVAKLAAEKAFWKSRVALDGLQLREVPDDCKDQEICQIATGNNIEAIQWTPDPFKDQEMCIRAMKKSPKFLKNIPVPILEDENFINTMRAYYFQKGREERFNSAMKNFFFEKLITPPKPGEPKKAQTSGKRELPDWPDDTSFKFQK